MLLMTSSRPLASTTLSSKTIRTITQATYPTLGVHRGAIDQTMITTGSPPDAMKRILSALETMGIVVEAEHEYRYRCTRPRRHTDSGDFGMVPVLGNDHRKGTISRAKHTEALEISNPPDNPDLDPENDFEKSFVAALSSGPVYESKEPRTTSSHDIIASPDTKTVHSSVPAEPSLQSITPGIRIHATPSPPSSTSSSTQPLSRHVPSLIHQENLVPPEPIAIPHKQHLLDLPSLPSSVDSDVGVLHAPPNPKLIAYGPRSEDPGEEVRFTTELTRLENLDTTYSLDIRRLKGNLRSYKFLYDTLRERADLQAVI